MKRFLDPVGLNLWTNDKLCIDPGPSMTARHHYLPVFVMVTSQMCFPQEVYSLSKTVKVSRVPILDSKLLSAPITFLLPELQKLVLKAKNGDLILIFAFVDPANVLDAATQQVRALADCSGQVVWGKLSMASLCNHLLKNANGGTSLFTLNGLPVEAVSCPDFAQGKLQHADTAMGPVIKMTPFRDTPIRNVIRLQVHVVCKEFGNSASSAQADSGAHAKLPYAVPLENSRNHRGNVEFHYLYYSNRCEKTEVTEEFSCPFCLVRCFSFKGLRCHLNCTHDLFNFEYLPAAETQIVNVTCRTDLLGPEGNIRELEPDLRTRNWMFWSRSGPLRRGSKSNPLRGDGGYLPGQIGRDLVDGSSRNPEPLVARDRNIPLNRLALDASGQKPQKPRIRGEKTKERDGFVALTETEKIVLSVKRQRLESRSSDARRGQAREDESPPIDAHGQVATAGAPFDELGLPSAPPVRIRAEKTRQATPEAAEARNRLQLLKRPFYHSHTGQPMAPEAVLSDRDSEDDVDEELAVLEDRRMLDDFVDVSNDEKDVMHLWNSFVRKQRVVADGHCQWACEAFTTLHSQYFASKPSLRRCLMLLLVKLWNHHLVDGSTLDKCLTIVDSCSAVTELPPT